MIDDRRSDFLFRWLGVVLLLALSWASGYWAGGSDEKAVRAIQCERGSHG